jgi:hypothetical protein
MGKNLLFFVSVPVLLVLLAAGLIYAQGPEPGPEVSPSGDGGRQEPLGARSPVGSAFTYQGQLKDGGGSPIDDVCDFSFGLWDAESGGSQVGSSCVVSGTAVVDGYFSAVVNGGGEFGEEAFTGEAHWLEIAVQCTGDATPVVLSPRQLLSAAPYALGLQPGAVISGTVVGGSGLMVINNGPAGRGILAHAGATDGTTYGVYGLADSTSGRGVYGHAGAGSGYTHGVLGQSDSTDGYGVYGWASASGGDTHGVLGQSDSTAGQGVAGLASATSGGTIGVYGRSDSANGYGVYAHASATSGDTYGVYAQTDAISGTTYGVFGRSGSTDGRGVVGHASATNGVTIGVIGQSDSPDGYGVYGHTTATSGDARGVFARSDSTAGCGVYGLAGAASGTTYGVFGISNSPDGYGVYYVGGIGGTGLRTSIVETPDHGWRHLYSVESTGPWFEDFGAGQLVDGRVVVTIDPLFAQTVNLSEEYHVFLTPLGNCGLYVVEKTATSFTVRALDGSSCSIAFDYRLIAKRLGYEDARLAPAEAPDIAKGAPELEVQP